MKKTNNSSFLRRGISLIVLVITILVMIVLVATVILTLSNSGLFNKSKEATFKAAMTSYMEELNTYLADKLITDGDIDKSSVNVSLVSSGENTNLKNIIKNVKKEHSIYLSIEQGELTFNIPENASEEEIKYAMWACQIGTKVKGIEACSDIKYVNKNAYLTGKFVNGVNTPNLIGFNISKARYIYYEDNGEVIIGETVDNAPKSNWYEYKNSTDKTKNKWANIIVMNGQDVSMFVWIPRYEYKVENNVTTVNYIPSSKTVATTGYKIPEAFTWDKTDDGGAKIELSGVWISKYKVSESNNYNIDLRYKIDDTSINVTADTTSSGTLKYMYYISQEGETPVKKNESSNNTYSFNNLKKGNTYDILVAIYNATDVNNMSLVGISKKTVYIGKAEEPTLTGYNSSNTRYVTYDSTGKEILGNKISASAPSSWYDYSNNKWANIKIINNYNISNFTWIPRYEYRTYKYNGTLRTDATYIPNSKVIATTGYKIPEAFTWDKTDDGGAKINLAGLWISKYKVSETDNYTLNYTYKCYGTYMDITVDPKSVSTGTVLYEYYLAKHGEELVKKGENSTGLYTFSNLTNGETYDVYVKIYNLDSSSNVIAILGEMHKTICNYTVSTPNLTGFNASNTKYISYNSDGDEVEGNLISGQAPLNWFDYTNNLWANIKVTANSKTVYLTWVPRYEYRVYKYNGTQKTDINYIPKAKTTPTVGYKIPEAFTWDKTDDGGQKINLEGVWISKYKVSQ